MRSSERCKVIEVYGDGRHIATIDAYEGSVNVTKLRYGFGSSEGLWYGDITGSAQTFTKAQILDVCREDIEHELFPSVSKFTYGRPKVYDIYEFYSL